MRRWRVPACMCAPLPDGAHRRGAALHRGHAGRRARRRGRMQARAPDRRAPGQAVGASGRAPAAPRGGRTMVGSSTPSSSAIFLPTQPDSLGTSVAAAASNAAHLTAYANTASWSVGMERMSSFSAAAASSRDGFARSASRACRRAARRVGAVGTRPAGAPAPGQSWAGVACALCSAATLAARAGRSVRCPDRPTAERRGQCG